ncbi:hypothetical protein [Dactylosporangium sp. CA-233914]|uniref:hypothetical protein n=1 Tax=Dactylosporangium sp. CA-233914 TaxID=3239934 RepID=UPI003D8CB1D5
MAPINPAAPRSAGPHPLHQRHPAGPSARRGHARENPRRPADTTPRSNTGEHQRRPAHESFSREMSRTKSVQPYPNGPPASISERLKNDDDARGTCVDRFLHNGWREAASAQEAAAVRCGCARLNLTLQHATKSSTPHAAQRDIPTTEGGLGERQAGIDSDM